MISQGNLRQLQELGIALQRIENQIKIIQNGVLYQTIDRAAVIGDGIVSLSDQEKKIFNDQWISWNEENSADVQSFIPASGAATRMFKILYSFIEGEIDDQHPEIKSFLSRITQFAFYEQLNALCIAQTHTSALDLIEQGKGVVVCQRLLLEDGLAYGLLPKGLLFFHKGKDEVIRTPVAEHLIEACQFRSRVGEPVKVHFSVSKPAEYLFKKQVNVVCNLDPLLKDRLIDIEFSIQKPSTDTIALDEDGNLFKDELGQLVFRPGGHGALIENLNDLSGQIIFIRNIDNIAPIHNMKRSMEDRAALAGFLIHKREQIFSLLNRLDQQGELTEIENNNYIGLLKELNIKPSLLKNCNHEKLRDSLNRPIRVCGMVKNVGEPGGGPFWVSKDDGTVLLILEKAQIDIKDKEQLCKFEKATHFNPVDIVCSIVDYQGNKFNLLHYVDQDQAFVVEKSIEGKKIQALELPGLWNGSMAGWITFFVDLPQEMFTPVKSVMDLLRNEHL